MSGRADHLALRVKSVSHVGSVRNAAVTLAVIVLAVCSAFIVASVLDVLLWLPGALRVILLLATVVGAIYLARKAYAAVAADFRNEQLAARAVESNFPEIERSLSTAIEFGNDPQKTEDYSSPELVGTLVKVTEARTAPLSFGRAVNWRSFRRAVAGVVAAVVLIAIYAVTLPHMASITALRFFAPFSDVPPPTWTLIDDVTPGTVEIPRGRSVRIEVSLSGSLPETVRLLIRGEGETEWAKSEMAPDAESRYARTLARVVRDTEYRIEAGDASSAAFNLTPIDEPRVEYIRLRVIPPEYTGLKSADLPVGSGDVRSPMGTEVEVFVRANTRKAKGALEFELGRERVKESVELVRIDEQTAEMKATFVLKEGGEYRVHLTDAAGRESSEETIYRLSAIPDQPPTVSIPHPNKDYMVAKDQKVTIELEASDDWGVSEIGIVSTVMNQPERIAVDKPKAGTREKKTTYPIDLSMRGLKGGEIITYYGYVLDNDGVNGPKETVGDIRFLQTYDENEYGQQSMQQQPPTPKAVKEVEKLIERQKDVTRDTFDIARATREAIDSEDPELKRASAEQTRLKQDLDEFIKNVELELAKREGDEQPAMRPEEIMALERATRMMSNASENLAAAQAREAAAPQSQAIASLSRTRRIMLSQSSSQSNSQQAMENAGREREQQRRQQQRQNRQELDEQMQSLPPILKKQEEARRKLERLEDEPPPQSQANEMAQNQRKLAEEAKQMASKLESASRNESQMSDKPQRRLLEAAQEMERAAEAAEQRDFDQAAEAAEKAEDKLADAQSAGQRELQEMDRQTAQGSAGEAKDLERRQNELAQSEGDEAERAEKQEDLKKDFEELMKDVEALSDRADREGRPEANSLRSAQLGKEDTIEDMDEAARLLRGGQAEESRNSQRAAANSLSQMSQDLERASNAAQASAQNELAEAARRAEELAKKTGELERSAKDPAQNTRELSGVADDLAKEAKALERAASSFDALSEDSPIKQAERSLRRAGRELERAGESLARPDRAAASESSSRAREDAEAAAKAMRDAAFGDLARSLAEARDEAQRAAKQQEEARSALDATGAEEGADKMDAARNAASRKETEAASSSRASAARLASAASMAKELESEMSELIEQEADRADRERLAEKMGELSSQLGLPSPGEGTSAKSSLEREQTTARELEKEARAAAGRLEALAAEAKDDELEALRAASEDARAMAEKLTEFQKTLEKIRGEAEGKTTGEGEGEGESEELSTKRVDHAPEAKGLEEDAKSLRARVERRAAEVLKGEQGSGEDLKEAIVKAEEALAKIATELSRNQPPRPTSALSSGARAYQILGEGLVKKMERIIKQREYRPPENELTPPEYRDLVEKYFRALSED